MIIFQPLRPYRTAFIIGLVFLVGFCLIFSLVYSTFSIEGFGRFFGITMLSSFVTGFQAKRSKAPWSSVKFMGVYILVILVVFLISSYGAMQHN